jgi:hypothetical protein
MQTLRAGVAMITGIIVLIGIGLILIGIWVFPR